jgi:hypothetical protein
MAPHELARLQAVDAAAKSYIQTQREIWQHRRNSPDGASACAAWSAMRDELADKSDEALIALTTAVGIDG